MKDFLLNDQTTSFEKEVAELENQLQSERVFYRKIAAAITVILINHTKRSVDESISWLPSMNIKITITM